jgi:hypothetical protein
LSAVRTICEDGLARGPNLGDGLRRVLTALEGLGELRPGMSQDLGVVERYLGGCRGLARHPLAAGLVTAMAREPDGVAWYPSRSYDDEPTMADFLPHYAVAMIFGPDRFGRRCPYASDRATLGVTLQAPGLDYPAHGHEAVEIYYILAGGADWQQGDGVWRRKVPGDFVLHEADDHAAPVEAVEHQPPHQHRRQGEGERTVDLARPGHEELFVNPELEAAPVGRVDHAQEARDEARREEQGDRVDSHDLERPAEPGPAADLQDQRRTSMTS